MNIEAAELKNYNANNRGKHSPDCVKRAISLAFDISYPDVSKMLNDKMHEKRRTQWNIKSVYEPVILDLGGSKFIDVVNDDIIVDEFAENNPSGSYILLVGPSTSKHNHLVCVRDGEVWDSWDSRQNYVHGYYKAVTNKQLRKLDRYTLNKFASDYLEPAVSKEILKYINKKNWNYEWYSVEPDGGAYKVIAKCQLVLSKDDIVTKDRKYDFRITLTIEPSWSDEEIIDFIQKTAKIRTYDRMYAINEQEKKLEEAYETTHLADEGTLKPYNPMYMTDQERKFVNSLPGWIQPLITGVDIYKPNQYPDSYRLKILKHPKDDMHPDQKSFTLEGWDASDIKMQIDRYKENFGIAGIDYYQDW